MNDILYYGFDSESLRMTDDSSCIIVVDKYELRLLNKLNVRCDTICSDMSLEFLNRYNSWVNSKKYGDKLLEDDFRLGSMAGYFTLEEIYARFDSLSLAFPEYFAPPDTIAYTFENRPIIAYTIGEQKNRKFEVLITALHHAREPGGASIIIYFLENLLRNSSLNSKEAKYLLANRTLYVIPVVNPDGYFYNQITKPQGGGMWRKNRFMINDSTYGIDLNRNYGPFEYWDAPINGSSDDPGSVTYRGSEAFSELETQAIRDFVLTKNIKLALNYHTYGNLLIYPLSALSKETNDSMFFRRLCGEYSKDNRYIFGLDRQTVNYSGRGVSDDWFYWTGGNKEDTIFAVTPEVGTVLDNFWTTPDRIIEQCRENLYMNYQLLWSADLNWRTKSVSSEIIDDKTVIIVKAANIGRTNALQMPEIILNSITGLIDISSSPIAEDFNDNDLEAMYSYSVNNQTANGDVVNIEVAITHQGVVRKDTFAINIWKQDRITLFADEVLTGNWNKGKWDGEFNDEKDRFVLSDSPNAFYENNDTNYLQLTDAVFLDFRAASLHFDALWEIEPNYDYGIVELSTDSGREWIKLDAEKMALGSGARGSVINIDETGFSGYSLGWVHSTISLNDFIGEKILLRFGMLSDVASNAPGWRLDDIYISTYSPVSSKTDMKDENLPAIYPNPAIDYINVYLGEEILQFREIKILDFMGKLIMKSILHNSNIKRIDISGLSPGIYFINIGSEFVRFIKY